MNAGGQLAGSTFPTSPASRTGAQPGPDRDTNLVMIKAYNDWHIDEWCVPTRSDSYRADSPVFDVANQSKRCDAWQPRDATPSPSARTRSAADALDLLRLLDPVFQAACDERSYCAVTWVSSRARRLRRTLRRVKMTLSSTMSIFTLVDLLWARSGSVSRSQVLLDRGGRGWIRISCGGRACARPPPGWTKHDFGSYSGLQRYSKNTSCAASSTIASA